MQQYMIRIVKALESRGYKKIDGINGNVYGRTQENTAYAVVVADAAECDTDNLTRLDQTLRMWGEVNILHILISPNGMFGESTLDIVQNIYNVWLFTADYGKLYVYENQPSEFDGLYEILDKKLRLSYEQGRRGLTEVTGVVTPCLVAANIIVFILGAAANRFYLSYPLEYRLALNVDAIDSRREYYRFFTAVFTHFGFVHLFGNMIVLVALGARIENVIGKIRFFAVYILTGIIASFSSYGMCRLGVTDYDYAAGASGAIMGLFGLAIVMAAFNKGHLKDLTFSNMALLFILTILDGFFTDGVDNVAHIAGFISGAVVGIVLMPANQKVVNNSHL